MHEEIAKLKPKRLPIPDLHLHEHFKKFFGYKKAIKYKVSKIRVETVFRPLGYERVDMPL